LYIAPEIIKGDKYGTSADLFSYAMTLAAFSLRGMSGFDQALHNWYFQDLQAKAAEDEAAKDKKNPKPEGRGGGVKRAMSVPALNLSRISHALASKDWRPSYDCLVAGSDKNSREATVPGSIAGLIILCWSPDPFERPHFGDVIDYLHTVAQEEISGKEGLESKSTRDGVNGAKGVELLEKISEVKKAVGVEETKVEKLLRERDALTERLQEMENKERLMK